MGHPDGSILDKSVGGCQLKVVDFNFTVAFCLLGMVYCGFNRFTFLPLLFCLSNSLSNAAAYWAWNVDKEGKSTANAASVFFTYLGYYLGETFIVLYGYFFVVRLLPERTGNG